MSQPKQARQEDSEPVSTDGLTSAQPHPGYCFHCREDGHNTVNCENDPNPAKVESKRCQLREKQAQWDLKNRVASPRLNSNQSL